MVIASVVLSVVLLISAVALGTVAVLGFRGKLSRNAVAGVRTESSMRSDETFTLANRVAAPTTGAAAVIFVIGAVAALIPGGILGAVLAIGATVVALVAAAYGGAMGSKAASLIEVPEQGGCGHSCISCSLKDACQPS